MSLAASLCRRWQLILAFTCMLVLASVAAGVGLQDVSLAMDTRIELDKTIAAATTADEINTLFITRHKVLENAYLFVADPRRVDRAEREVVALDQQILDGLAKLRASVAVSEAERLTIDDIESPYWAYRARSDTAIRLLRSNDEPFHAQQRAVDLTYLQDRPVSLGLTSLARQVNERASQQAAEVDANGRSALRIAIAAMVGALVLGAGVFSIGIVRDTAARKRTEGTLRDSAARLELESERLLALHRATTVLAAQSATPDAVLKEVLKNAVALTGATGAGAYRWDAQAGVLRSAREWQIAQTHELRDVMPGCGLAGQAFVRGEPVIVNDYQHWDMAISPESGTAMTAGLGVPLIRSGKCLGVLVLRVYGDDPTRFTEDDARIATLFADQAAVALSAADALEAQRWTTEHDALTGLPNRVLLKERLQAAIETVGPSPHPMALLVMDLDRFKEINDTLGHQAGDLLLQHIGPRIQAALGEHDTLARLGGDEFALLLASADAGTARRIAERVLEALEEPFELAGAGLEVGGSIGIAMFPDHAADADTLLRHADVAMYMAKEARSGWAIYAPDRDHHSPERLALVADLRRAIDNDELTLHYQPQVDVRSGALGGVEALVRWPHPERGLLAPDTFIPLAEQTRLIRPLTQWAIGAALRQIVAWRQSAGLAVPVAVNLSAHDLQDTAFPERVAGLLEKFSVDAAMLRLEITEGSLLADPKGARENLVRLRALGVQIAIDDFGTGYSSLSYLQRLPVDELKIDRSFVKDMALDESARAIVRAVIDLADDLGLRVVAEGVEDPATWEVLAALGCDLAQGYYFGPPLPASGLADWAAGMRAGQLAEPEQQRIELALSERVRQRGARLTAEEEFMARKRAETALRESEERLRLAVEAADVATWDWDLVGEAITWSGGVSSLFGAEAGAVDRSSGAFFARVHPDDRLLIEAAVDEAVHLTGELRVEHRIVQIGGAVRWVARRGRVLRDVGGRPVRLLGTDVDITDRKESERQRERLVQADKLRARIVERHRGRIDVESGVGQGTTIRLNLPGAPVVIAGIDRYVTTGAPGRRPLRVLAVDDEPLIGKMVARILRAERHVVVTATSGEEAVERLQAESFDVVISDVGMGQGMNGWELAARVRQDWPGLGFVFATGWGAQIDLVEARSKGIDAVLAKPYRPDDLLEVLARLGPGEPKAA